MCTLNASDVTVPLACTVPHHSREPRKVAQLLAPLARMVCCVGEKPPPAGAGGTSDATAPWIVVRVTPGVVSA